MKMVWTTIAAVALASFALKAAGPLMVGGRELPRRVVGVVALLAPALLAALVTVETFSDAGNFVVDAKVAGVGAAAVALAFRAPLLVVVAVAAATTALVRLA
jgi:branched chain amino acid efflux pump